MSEEIPTVEIEDFDPEAEADIDTAFKGHPFIELLGSKSKVKIILAMLRVRGDKLRPTDIYTAARISHDTWHNHKPMLVDKYGVIEHVGKIGNSPLYRMPEDDELVDKLDELLSAMAEREREHIN